jgi:hypothetical protein
VTESPRTTIPRTSDTIAWALLILTFVTLVLGAAFGPNVPYDFTAFQLGGAAFFYVLLPLYGLLYLLRASRVGLALILCHNVLMVWLLAKLLSGWSAFSFAAVAVILGVTIVRRRRRIAAGLEGLS